MRPLWGAVGPGPKDGMLRGRLGMRRWLRQCGLSVVLLLVGAGIFLGCFFGESLVGVIVVSVLATLGLVLLRLWQRPLSWIGWRPVPPPIFDLRADGSLEVGTWGSCMLVRTEWTRDEITDLRIFRIPALGSGGGQPTAIDEENAARMEPDLPRPRDALREMANLCAACGGGAPLQQRPLAVAFLGASIRGQVTITRLSADASTPRALDELLALARAARHHLGLGPSGGRGPADVEAPEEAPEEEDDDPDPEEDDVGEQSEVRPALAVLAVADKGGAGSERFKGRGDPPTATTSPAASSPSTSHATSSASPPAPRPPSSPIDRKSVV